MSRFTARAVIVGAGVIVVAFSGFASACGNAPREAPRSAVMPTTLPSTPSQPAERPGWQLSIQEQDGFREAAMADAEVRELLVDNEVVNDQVIVWGSESEYLGGVVIYSLRRPIELPAGLRRVYLDSDSPRGYRQKPSRDRVVDVTQLMVAVAADTGSVVSITSGIGGRVLGPRVYGGGSDH